MNILKMLIIAITAVIYSLFGGFDLILKCLLLLMMMDYLSGIMKALYNNNLSSQIGFFGILKKIFILIIVILANTLDKILMSQGLKTELIRNTTIIYYILNEMISIIENIGEFIPVPEKIKKIIEKLKEDG